MFYRPGIEPNEGSLMRSEPSYIPLQTVQENLETGFA